MKILKGNIFFPDGTFRYGRITIEQDKIAEVKELDESALQETEKNIRIIPGLVDIHSHGCVGHDTCEATAEELYEMLEFEKSRGITSYCPTTMTYGEEKLLHICRTIRECNHPNIKGIYLEGPFISKEKKGAQNEAYIMKPDAEMVRRLKEASGGLAKIIAIAPETENALAVIGEIKDEIRVSVAHTNATYEIAKEAFKTGAKQVTHLYNAMPAYNHRKPGVIGAAYDCEEIMAELISDGIHVHEAVIRNTFRQMGDRRVILISDSMEATGMENGTYALGGQTVYVKDRVATLTDGTIAGSASTLFDCLKHAVEIEVPVASAIWAATRNPARAIGIYDQVGSIEAGKQADLILISDGFELLEVIQGE